MQRRRMEPYVLRTLPKRVNANIVHSLDVSFQFEPIPRTIMHSKHWIETERSVTRFGKAFVSSQICTVY